VTLSAVQRLKTVAAELDALEDPAAVAVRSIELLELVRELEQQVCDVRDDALVALHRQPCSLQEIAALTGLSRGRVHQIIQQRTGT
jgi:DNA-directed RNA polymerase sigma subunit (sigma70/sigma32)